MTDKKVAGHPGSSPDEPAKEPQPCGHQSPQHHHRGDGNGVNKQPDALRNPPEANLSPRGEAAVAYARANIPVFPLLPGSKIPFSLNTPGMSVQVGGRRVGGVKLATTDTRQIIDWWSSHPGANVAMPTGSKSGFVVLDMDSAMAWLAVCERGFDANAPHASGTAGKHDGASAKGHFYFKCCGPLKSRSYVAGVENLELLGDGKYVVLPPSVHPNGRVYTWLNPGIIERGRGSVPELPGWVLSDDSEPRRPKSGIHGRREQKETQKTNRPIDISLWHSGPLAPTGKLNADINRVLHSEETARRLVEHSGQSWPGIGRDFRCLMSLDTNGPSAAIWRGTEDGRLSYRDFHDRCRDEEGEEVDFLPLGVVWAAIYTGTIRILGKGELPAWSIRMVLDLNLYPAPPLLRGLRKDEQ